MRSLYDAILFKSPSQIDPATHALWLVNTADGDKVPLECLDCTFGLIQAMISWGCKFVGEAVLFDGGDEFVGDFIIKVE